MDKTRKQIIKELKKEFEDRVFDMRNIINSYEIIPHAPRDEFDALNHTILSHLYKDADTEKIKRIIESELCQNYGLFIYEFDTDEIAIRIIEWWKNENSL